MSNLLTLKPEFSRYSEPLFATLMLGLLLTHRHSVSSLSRFLSHYPWSVDTLRCYRQDQLTAAILLLLESFQPPFPGKVVVLMLLCYLQSLVSFPVLTTAVIFHLVVKRRT